eukprot:TRINITY_DN72076_c0_g1_i1.p1 TRINITY_DN72076_c0_g1~~TRINITY_DN72076_c0_g1_i1.p1  ORF type:complete len:226 (-),score=58.31 TRINITY_DN72076_c0_g1_i1:50-727(-)
MGGNASVPNQQGSLALQLGSAIQEALRPSPEQIQQVWERRDPSKMGLPRREVQRVLDDLLELQLEAAKQKAAKAKSEVAKQQARLERACRSERAELTTDSFSPSSAGYASERVSDDERLDRCTALTLGSAVAPVMAGVLAGYVDMPFTCLTALRKDKELLHERVELLFKKYSPLPNSNTMLKEETLSMEDFMSGYNAFFDRITDLLHAAGTPVDDVDSGSGCNLH